MKLKDRIGAGISNFLYPYIQNEYRMKGDYMKMSMNREKYLLNEKYLWFLGCEDLLADFYQTRKSDYSVIDTRSEYYYSNVGSNIRVIHSGLPSLISYSKARLLMSGGLEYGVYKGKDKEDKKTTETLKLIYNDNKLDGIIKNSVVTESWGKQFAWKISFDKEISEYPIVELYKPQDYKCVYKKGRLQEIIFFNYYDKNGTDYRLEETYGKGYIKYELYQCNKDGNEVLIALTELEETAELEDVEWNEKTMIAGAKEIVKSDYDGIISEFDALDETWSQLMDEIRLARSEVYIPEMLLTNRTFNKFRKNYAQLGNDERESGKNAIEHIQPNIRTDEYGKAIDKITSNCLVDVGLDPFTVGIDSGIGANASGENLTKREASSLRTRGEMIDEWEPFLEEFFLTLLFANLLFNNGNFNKIAKLDDSLYINVSFGDYISPTRKDLIEETKMMKEADIIDTEKAIDEIFGDEITEEEKLRILANLGNITEPDTSIPDEEDNNLNNDEESKDNDMQDQKK